MRWLRILWVKLLAGIIGIGAGLSLGREGPSIQLGAVTAQGLSRLLKRTRLEERYRPASGASAGLAAATKRSVSGRYFYFRRIAPQFFRSRPAASHGSRRNDCNGYFCVSSLATTLFFDFFGLPFLPLEYYGYVALFRPGRRFGRRSF